MQNVEEVSEITSQIAKRAESIKPEKIAKEIINWLLSNIESFIDNHKKRFKLDLVIDEKSQEILPETKKLQDLYLYIPHDESVCNKKIETEDDIKNLDENTIKMLTLLGECRSKLDLTVRKAHDIIREDNESLGKLFERMSFFYELKGINRGEFLVQRVNGAVDITDFEYESFTVPIKIKRAIVGNVDGEDVKIGEEVIKEYTIPEGFSLTLEISLKPRLMETMF